MQPKRRGEKMLDVNKVYENPERAYAIHRNLACINLTVKESFPEISIHL